MITTNLPENPDIKPITEIPEPKPVPPPESMSDFHKGTAEKIGQTPEIISKPLKQESGLELPQTREQTRQPGLEEEGFLDEKIEALKKKLKRKNKKVVVMPRTKDELTIRIEKVMEENMTDVFRELSKVQQQEFKMKGEETAYKIRQALKKTHVKVKEIFRLLIEWLRMLPGINKFFLEQEAKIKADKILAIREIHRNK